MLSGARALLIRTACDIKSSEITPRQVYLNRRDLMAGGVALGGATLLAGQAFAAKLDFVKSTAKVEDKLTPLKDVTSYNNFYEFGLEKTDAADKAHTLTTSPWSVKGRWSCR